MHAAAAVVLLLLHAADGHEIRVNPEHVTHLHAARPGAPAKDKIFSDNVKCLVNLADGKFVTVIEPCEVVQKMLEQAR